MSHCPATQVLGSPLDLSQATIITANRHTFVSHTAEMADHIASCVLCGDQVRDSGPEWMRHFIAGKQTVGAAQGPLFN